MQPEQQRQRLRVIFRLAPLVLGVCILLDAVGLWWLLGGSAPLPAVLLHAAAALAGSAALPWALRIGRGRRRRQLFLQSLSLSLPVPLVALPGLWLALWLAVRQSAARSDPQRNLVLTAQVALPFTTPRGREAGLRDSRGFQEQLRYVRDGKLLHRKVLAAGHISEALAVSSLKQAMQHEDERVRLTAYNTLDRKVNRLNRKIQQLEHEARLGGKKGRGVSSRWLQISGYYWELLTLEKDEPVARQQLLERSAAAAMQAVVAFPLNRNAHYNLGRVSLLQGERRRARIAFERALALGVAPVKVLPYLAELAFVERDFPKVRQHLASLAPAHCRYPPLSHLVEYWT